MTLALHEEIILNRREILLLSPHGPNFCFIHGVTYLDKEKLKICGFALIKPEYFQGHFKNTLVFPKVLKDEVIAQLGACLIRSIEKFKDCIPIFSGESCTKDIDMVLPGDRMDVELEVLDFDGRKEGSARGRGYVQGNIVHELSFEFKIMKETALDKIIKKKIKARNNQSIICPKSYKMWLFQDEEDQHFYLSKKEIAELKKHIPICWQCRQELKRLNIINKELAESFEKWAKVSASN